MYNLNAREERWFSGADWGDVPTWVGAVGSIGALAAAVVAAVVAKGLYDMETRRDDRMETDRRAIEDERRREQAVLVSAWFFERSAGSSRRVRAGVRNASQAPVYDVVVRWEQAGTPLGSNQFPVLPPSDEPIDVPMRGQGDEPQPDPDAFTDTAVWIEFTDAAGQRWLRNVDGELIQQTGGRRSASPQG